MYEKKTESVFPPSTGHCLPGLARLASLAGVFPYAIPPFSQTSTMKRLFSGISVPVIQLG